MFVCTAALTILDRLDLVDVETLGWWLAERQLPSGGLNGRPEKLEDVRHILFSCFFLMVTLLPLPRSATASGSSPRSPF